MAQPHPKLVPLLVSHNLTFEQFSKKGRLAADQAFILERRRDLVTALHEAGTSWAEMTEITGFGLGTLNRLTRAVGNEASRRNRADNAAERGRARKGEKKPWLTTLMKQQWAEGKFDFHRGNQWTPEQKEKLRKAKHGRHGIWKLIDTDKGGRIHTRSSWERLAAVKLDADPNVVRFEFETPIEVGLDKFILPDFIVTYADDSIILIEVKPKFITELPEDHKDVVRLKVAKLAAEARGWGFQIWTEVELGIPAKYRESNIPANQLPFREVKDPLHIP